MISVSDVVVDCDVFVFLVVSVGVDSTELDSDWDVLLVLSEIVDIDWFCGLSEVFIDTEWIEGMCWIN